jgi:hypothetical protein
VNGDGWLDLAIGGIGGSRPVVFRNLGDGTFQEITSETGIIVDRDTFSVAFGDYDRDGLMDLLVALARSCRLMPGAVHGPPLAECRRRHIRRRRPRGGSLLRRDRSHLYPQPGRSR